MPPIANAVESVCGAHTLRTGLSCAVEQAISILFLFGHVMLDQFLRIVVELGRDSLAYVAHGSNTFIVAFHRSLNVDASCHDSILVRLGSSPIPPLHLYRSARGLILHTIVAVESYPANAESLDRR